ncbi:MAG: HEAT repeat domain-containing protein [Thermostichales cyanobacterium SZTDM-1c_bins_54]
MIAPLVAAVAQAQDPQALLAAVQALAASRDPEAIPHLIKAFGYNQPAVSEAALAGVVAFGALAVEPLLTQIDGYDYGARAYSVRALAKIGDPRAVNFLLDAVVADFAPSVRRAALRGLGKVASPVPPQLHSQLQEVFRRCAQDSDWGIRYALVCTLADLGCQNFGEVAAMLVQDRDPLVQAKAKLALAG